MKSKRILITGGTGFQGSNLSRRLLASGYEIKILDTLSNASEENIVKFKLQNTQVVWGSITDKNLVDKTVRDVDLVVHLAANIHVDDSISEPVKYYEVNILGTNNILECVRKRNIPIVHVSTCEVYGFQENELTENSPFMANSPYASSKAGADVMCRSYHKTYDMDVTILRPANVFGPGQRYGKRGSVIPIWVHNLLIGKNINIYGDGSQSREFIYIDDLVDVYEKIIENKLHNGIRMFSGEVFNIGSNQQITMNELSKIIFKNITVREGQEIRHSDARSGEVNKFVLNSSKIMKCLDWIPKVSIEEGLREYIKWIETNK